MKQRKRRRPRRRNRVPTLSGSDHAAFASTVGALFALLFTIWGVAEGGERRSEVASPEFVLVTFSFVFVWAYSWSRFGLYRALPPMRIRVPQRLFNALSSWPLAAGLFIAAAVVHYLAA
jgi:hypothetical protein